MRLKVVCERRGSFKEASWDFRNATKWGLGSSNPDMAKILLSGSNLILVKIDHVKWCHALSGLIRWTSTTTTDHIYEFHLTSGMILNPNSMQGASGEQSFILNGKKNSASHWWRWNNACFFFSFFLGTGNFKPVSPQHTHTPLITTINPGLLFGHPFTTAW